MQIPIIVIQGATASGKSSFAISLAKELNGEIISADSRQVYKKLNIGTAKVTDDEMKEIPHHLINIVEPDEIYNAGRFVEDASNAIFDIHSRNKTPIVVGGTGMYVKALLEGLIEIPDASQEIKEKMEKISKDKTPEEIKKILEKIDPISAGKTETQDVQKMIRALEVFEITNKPISQHWAEQKDSNIFVAYRIFLNKNRKVLYDRINRRIDKMLNIGLLKEIDNLLQSGYKENDPGMISVGYREFYPFFRGEEQLEESIRLAKKHSRNYAKRQLTWFRRIQFDLTLDANDINICDVKQKIIDWKVDK